MSQRLSPAFCILPTALCHPSPSPCLARRRLQKLVKGQEKDRPSSLQSHFHPLPLFLWFVRCELGCGLFNDLNLTPVPAPKN